MNKKKIISVIAFAPLIAGATSLLVSALLGIFADCNIFSQVSANHCILGGIDLYPLQNILFLGSIGLIIAIPWALGVFAVSVAVTMAARYVKGISPVNGVAVPVGQPPVSNETSSVATPKSANHLIRNGLVLVFLTPVLWYIPGILYRLFPQYKILDLSDIIFFVAAIFSGAFGISLVIGGIIKNIRK